MTTTTTEPINTVPEKEHGPFYWIFANSLLGLKRFALNHKKFTFISGFLVLWSIFVFRAYWQPYVVFLRAHSPEVLLAIVFLVLVNFLWKKRRFKWLCIAVGFSIGVVWLHLKMELPPLRYLTLYFRYKALPHEELQALPTTDHERIQPLNSIRVLGSEAMAETEQVSEPNFVRNGTNYRWTLAIEPVYEVPKVLGSIKQVLDVSGTASSPNFSGQNRIPVKFRIGQDMHFGKNSEVATIRSLGLFRFFSYSPRDTRYIVDDKGKMVQVISLIKWKGFIFVWPEFGGVQVVEQEDTSFFNMARSWFLGDGKWIRPDDVGKYSYLRGQNTVPYEVSRYAAMSVRFQNGFMTPFPGYHKGDIRIPDLPGDANDQPFTTYFRFTPQESSANKLWHYFALEPYHVQKQGLNTSLFMPADGIGNAKVYRHYLRSEALTGVSAIAAKVKESKKEYDWEQSLPAEHRPFIREIDGRLRMFWLTTVVTYKDKAGAGRKEFIAGSTPAVTLTDAVYKNVVWVNPHDSSKWTSELQTNLGAVWKSN